MRLHVYPGKDLQWYLRVIAMNGEIVLDSEGFSTRSNAIRAAKRWRLLLLAPTVARIEVEKQ